MTIEQIGSIGEAVAALATIATLLYLALQIRASRLATMADARRSIRSDNAQTMRLIAQDAEVSRIFLRGLYDSGFIAYLIEELRRTN